MPVPKTSAHILCIDLGGTKSAASRVTPSGEVVFRTSAPTPSQAGPRAIVPFLIKLTKRTWDAHDAPLLGIGISAGAPANAAEGIVYTSPNLPDWDGPDGNGTPLARLLSEHLGGLPTYLENDTDATALVEHRFGAGKGVRDMAFLTIGTGIGAGLIVNGELHRGSDGAGGEIGHIAVEPNGRLCTCGLRGCLEAYASGPSLVRVARENGFAGMTGHEVVQAAREGDVAARAAVEQAARMLGCGLATLTMLLNPEIIVLGTLAVHAGDLLLPLVRKTVAEQTWPRLRRNLQIVPAALGDKAQDVAALCAFLHRYEKTVNAL